MSVLHMLHLQYLKCVVTKSESNNINNYYCLCGLTCYAIGAMVQPSSN